MTWEEHEELQMYRAAQKEREGKLIERLVEQEKIMEDLMSERDDIVVMTNHHVKVGQRLNLYGRPESVYIDFPRFIGTDEVAKEIDDSIMNMRAEILRLQTQLSDMVKAKYNKLSRRQKRKLENILLKVK